MVISKIYKEIASAVDSLEDELFSFIQKLVQIPSLPGLEQKAQELVADKLKELKLDIDIVRSNFDELKEHPAFCDDNIPYENRINVIGRWCSSGKEKKDKNKNARSLILNGHVDVVSPGNEDLWDYSPWSGKIKDGKLFGRGACDMKAGLASAIFAIKALQKLGFQPKEDVLLESVIGEESGGVGSLTTIIKGYKADAVIILEPTKLQICPVQAGALTFRIKLRGKSVHACMKKSGVNAIEKFYTILQAINDFEHKRHLNYQNPLYKDPMNVAPICIGTIEGGDWHSTVAAEVMAEGRYGVFPGESAESAKKDFRKILEQAANKDHWLKEHPPILEWFEGQFESGVTDISEPIIKTVSECHEIISGKEAQVQGVTYGADLRLFTNYGKMPTILYGPGDVINTHTINEFIQLKDVLLGTKVIALTIFKWCGGM
jgi:acetylornithine deacetylase